MDKGRKRNQFKTYISQNTETSAVILLLVLLVVILLGYCYHVKREIPQKVDIVGTYARKAEPQEQIYLVFDQEGGYTKYDHSGILEKGVYIFTESEGAEEADRIEVRVTDGSDGSDESDENKNGGFLETEMLLFGSRIYCFNENTDQFDSYEKENDIPVFRDYGAV